MLARLTWLPALVLLGLVPTGLFMFWAEEMGHSPGFAQLAPFALRVPALQLPALPLATKALFDLGLFLAFGLVHSALAQEPLQRRLARVVGAAQVRALYVIVAGSSLFALTAAWQTLGLRLWTWVPDSPLADRFGHALFYALMALVGQVIAGAGSWDFLGFGPVWRGVPADAGTPLLGVGGQAQLKVTGAYAWVRHPGYALLLLGLLAGNAMTLDRLVIFAGAFVYLLAGIPIEERKLVRQFGPAYEEYRRRVPALVPFI